MQSEGPMNPPVCTRCGAPVGQTRTQFCDECGAPVGLAPDWRTTPRFPSSHDRVVVPTAVEEWSETDVGADGQDPITAPPAPPSVGAGSTSAWLRFRNRSTALALIVLAATGAIWFLLGRSHRSNQVVNHIGLYAFVYLAVLWLGIMLVRYLQFLGECAEAGRRAMVPIPTPQEIATQLHVELGRPPTLVEVAAVQQMLATARNQDLITAGMGVASWLAVRESLEKKE